MSYPSTIDTFTDPLGSNKLASPSHSAIERAQNAALAALEATVGVTGSAVPTSLQYKVVNPLSIDPGHLHTSSGFSGNFPVSRLTGSFPATGVTFGASSIPASAVIFTASSVPSSSVYFPSGAPGGYTSSTINIPQGTTSISIPHGLGAIPSHIKMRASYVSTPVSQQCIRFFSEGTWYNNIQNNITTYGTGSGSGTANSDISSVNIIVLDPLSTNTNGHITLDATNINLVITNNPVSGINILWEAFSALS